MITLAEVKLQINEQKEMYEENIGPLKNRAKKKWDFLRVIEAYIESQPSEEFVRSELRRLEKRNDLILQGWDAIKVQNPKWLKEQEKAARTKYNADMNMTQLRLQIRALRVLNK